MSGYFMTVWVEGLTYRTGEKIKSISPHSIEYTTKITEALRVKPCDWEAVKRLLTARGITFTPRATTYALPGTIFKL